MIEGRDERENGKIDVCDKKETDDRRKREKDVRSE